MGIKTLLTEIHLFPLSKMSFHGFEQMSRKITIILQKKC
ncbi:hypothetical protein CWATWH8502_4601 [Crocosphaera watsonii WH 8502]|uniref:Uncharacterized protein n=3 Tax=Crocosphaera watsonii TaxID=263511 RepID=T2JX10_CROWT|nr:hypothetical protein CWATWH8502_4601 [Crocosphaera watsonii WH 8502]CCQ56615.1 hypothetical protein CWATWH0005_12 [Crocosphaera watsonii WH 0005]CCQ69609.1 hypothetical protein CWATWH0402_3254 [Crocosphaera watsonii WH 0402]